MSQTLPQTDPAIIDQILSILKTSTSFSLSGHQNPDADVVGSQLAMASLIERLGPGKQIDVQNSGQPPKYLSFLSGYQSVKNVDKVDRNYDVAISFECSGQDRMGNIIDFKTQAKHVINIDHHLHNPNFGTINWVEPHTSSTAEMIFKIFERSGLPLQKSEAICLFTGLVADTGWMRYSNTNTQTLRIAEKLVAAGVPVADLSERIYMSRTIPSVRLLGWVLTNLKLSFNNRLAIMQIPDGIYREVGATADDTDEIVNAGLKIDSVQAAVLLKEKKDQNLVKISIRSKGTLDINRVARAFGGGGHKNASGCVIQGSLEQAEDLIGKEFNNVFGD
jgi:bifunctional oligoribonuclease and PAP phosphatase NrnA